MTGRSDAASSVDEVLDLFGGHAGDRYDEDLTQLDHALQTAALAIDDGASDELVGAALLHDVGHLLSLRDASGPAARTVPPDGADLLHEARGARWLARLYPPGVTGPIALHVAAKRFMCATDPAYHAALSRGSRASLLRQGGPMGAEEVSRFRANPAHVDAVRLRRWDDSGKRLDGVEVAALAAYRPLLELLVRS
jgi:predicted HD phosphohydrolase